MVGHAYDPDTGRLGQEDLEFYLISQPELHSKALNENKPNQNKTKQHH